MNDTTTLADCKAGQSVILNKVNDRQLTIQLYSMGCILGETIRVERIAPFGDPMIINIEDSFISLRRDDALNMEVSKI